MPSTFQHAGDSCTADVFKQFVHWVVMQLFSDEEGPAGIIWEDMGYVELLQMLHHGPNATMSQVR